MKYREYSDDLESAITFLMLAIFILAIFTGYFFYRNIQKGREIKELKSIIGHKTWQLDGFYYFNDPWGQRWMVEKDSCELVWGSPSLTQTSPKKL